MVKKTKKQKESIKMLLKTFFDVLFNKILIRHRMKKNLSKLQKTRTSLQNFLCLFLMIKDTH